MDWKDRPTLVTGGASFIGSHLVERLIDLGARIRVIDNLSSGRVEYLQDHVHEGTVEYQRGDLLDQDTSRAAVGGMNVVFHLAADHGGRGYVDLHQAACATNLALDGILPGCASSDRNDVAAELLGEHLGHGFLPSQ